MAFVVISNSNKAVTIDLWQTIVLDRPQLGVVRSALRIDGILRVLEKQGMFIDREDVERAYLRNSDDHWKMQHDSLDQSFDNQIKAFLNQIRPELACELDGVALRLITERYARPFLAYPPVLTPGTREVLGILKRCGYRMALISNTGMTPGHMFRDYLVEQGIAHYFEAWLFSDEVRLSKPAPAIFHQALTLLGATASSAVHVGDSIHSDVGGAKSIGMKAIWIKGVSAEEPKIHPDATITRLWELPDALESLALT